MCGHSLEKVEIQVRKLTEHVVNTLYVLKKWINLLLRSLWMKRVMVYLRTSVISLAIITQNCEGRGKTSLSLYFFLHSGRLQFIRSLFLIQNSFKRRRIYQALSGGDKTADLIRKGFGALQPPQMTSLEVVGAETLLKLSLHILYMCLVQGPPRKPQDSAESGGVSTELGELTVSEDSFSFHVGPKEMP